ncbi:RWD domain-containing protein [Lophiotrema nucula]|uniref:RWD domain-containing protein n=1 Tax=Lophiotrema nucula TaxID=690887 RepID=A0A6A5ZJ05_9PLEO|nr:RWD domain-containing protein [Lophiotrema nucula]
MPPLAAITLGSLHTNERLKELETLQAIFSDEAAIGTSSFTAHIGIPVVLDSPITLESSSLANSYSHSRPQARQQVSHLPPLQLMLSLPLGYPSKSPPLVRISTERFWFPDATSHILQEKLLDLWEQYGHSQVLFSYISELQEEARSAFGLSSRGLEVSENLETFLLEYDIERRREIFEAKNFDCGICLSAQKGSSCYQMECCEEVQLAHGQILSDTCGKGQENAGSEDYTSMLTPHELFEIGLEVSEIQRYVDVLRRNALRADSTTIWCLRKGCKGVARDKDYPRIDVSLLRHKSSLSHGIGNPNDVFQRYLSRTKERDTEKTKERLAICEDCNYAFCIMCCRSWHGDAVICNVVDLPGPKAPRIADIKSIRYIYETGAYCPSCATAYIKTEGCYSMFCPKCQTVFCYRCGAKLPHYQGTCQKPEFKEFEWKGITYEWTGGKSLARSKKKG